MSENNGKATTQTITPSKREMYVLRVFRVEAGMNVIARMLSEEYGGCFTHYFKGRSNLCHGKDCEMRACLLHRTWKGYAAIEIWHDAKKVWMPWCLEITERLELDFRGLYARGQIWELYRELQSDAKKTPVMGKLLETRDGDSFPPAFDLVPVLRSLYHVDWVDLRMTNPMPMQTYVQESPGDAPEIIRQIEEKKKAQKEAPPFNFSEEFNRRKKSPTEKKAEKT